jgi:hypothetical protein
MALQLVVRQQHEVNTDPQRRCYNGCHFSSELQWSSFELLQTVTPENSEERLTFWRELNDYAVSQRGESARKEFKII